MMPETNGTTPRLVLASHSPRRRELLERLGCHPVIAPTDSDETVLPGEHARDLVRRLALRKVEAADAGAADLVIAADTEVALEGESFGKPVDAADAATMLIRLAGRTHDVYTGVAVRVGDRTAVGVASVAVHVRPLDEADIAWYLATGEPMGKAGAYALQGAGGLFITGIDGSYDAVVGLPLHLVQTLAQEVGVDLLGFCAGRVDASVDAHA